jgi:hypothetical protein
MPLIPFFIYLFFVVSAQHALTITSPASEIGFSCDFDVTWTSADSGSVQLELCSVNSECIIIGTALIEQLSFRCSVSGGGTCYDVTTVRRFASAGELTLAIYFDRAAPPLDSVELRFSEALIVTSPIKNGVLYRGSTVYVNYESRCPAQISANRLSVNLTPVELISPTTYGQMSFRMPNVNVGPATLYLFSEPPDTLSEARVAIFVEFQPTSISITSSNPWDQGQMKRSLLTTLSWTCTGNITSFLVTLVPDPSLRSAGQETFEIATVENTRTPCSLFYVWEVPVNFVVGFWTLNISALVYNPDYAPSFDTRDIYLMYLESGFEYYTPTRNAVLLAGSHVMGEWHVVGNVSVASLELCCSDDSFSTTPEFPDPNSSFGPGCRVLSDKVAMPADPLNGRRDVQFAWTAPSDPASTRGNCVLVLTSLVYYTAHTQVRVASPVFSIRPLSEHSALDTLATTEAIMIVVGTTIFLYMCSHWGDCVRAGEAAHNPSLLQHANDGQVLMKRMDSARLPMGKSLVELESEAYSSERSEPNYLAL